MKKIIAFLLCLCIVLSAAACAPSDRPDDIDNSSEPSISVTKPEEKIYYEIKKVDDTTSKYYVYGKDGTVLLEGETDRPIDISVSGSIVDVAITVDEYNITHRYYDVETDRLSEEFSYAAASSGDLVAYVDNIENHTIDDNRVLIVRDMFDKDIFYKSFSLDWAPTMQNPIESASFTEGEGEISIVYWSERPAVRFHTTLPVRSDSTDYNSKCSEVEIFEKALEDEIKVYDTSTGSYTYLTSYTPFYSKTPFCERDDLKYTYADTDGDGVDELIIDCGDIFILRYYMDTVCVYPFVRDDAVSRFSTDGTFYWNYAYSYGPAYGEKYIFFEGIEIYKSELWRVVNDGEPNAEYYIGYNQVTEEELQKYLADNPRTKAAFFSLELKWKRKGGEKESWEKVNKYWNYADGQEDGAVGTVYTGHVLLKEDSRIDPRFFWITLDHDVYNQVSNSHRYIENFKQMLVDSETGELYDFRASEPYDGDWVNTEKGEIIDPYIKPITPEEALNLAKLYWDRYDIEKNKHIVTEGVNDSAPETVYVFIIKRLVDMGDDSTHYSTFNEIWIDKYAGEAVIPH